MLQNKEKIPEFIDKIIKMMKVFFLKSKEYPDLINWGNQGE